MKRAISIPILLYTLIILFTACASDDDGVPENIINVEDFGAIGDGVTNDASAINAALKEAAMTKAAIKFDSKKTYLCSKQLLVKNGVTEISGGTLVFKIGIASDGIKLIGKEQGLEENVKDLSIHNMHITTNSYGIVGFSVSRVKIYDNEIIKYGGNGGAGIYLVVRKIGLENSIDNNIINNNITLLPADGHQRYGQGISVASELDFKYPKDDYFTAPATNLWVKDKTYGKPYFTIKNTVITNNKVNGGYYGISLSGAQSTLIKDNHSINNMRSISIQNGSHHNKVINNTFLEMKSASIHLAYGSSDNHIKGNTIISSIAVGEGLLQAYVGTKHNVFENNTVESSSETGPRWMAYIAIHADGNVLINNTFKGSYYRACIAIEPAWDETQPHISHRGSYLTKDYKHHVWANKDTDGVIIENNVLNVHSVRSDSPEIFYSQITDDLGIHKLTNLVIKNNTLLHNNPNYTEPYFLED